MEPLDRRASETVSFVVTMLFLTAMAVTLLIMFVLATRGTSDAAAAVPTTMAAASSPVHAAPQAGDRSIHQLKARLAWLSITLLGLTILMAFWIVARYLHRRMSLRADPRTTDYVDAWSLAGQRVKPLNEPNEGDKPPQLP